MGQMHWTMIACKDDANYKIEYLKTYLDASKTTNGKNEWYVMHEHIKIAMETTYMWALIYLNVMEMINDLSVMTIA